MCRSLGLMALMALSACGPSPDQPVPATAAWTVVHEELPGALMSVWGTSQSDVWAVGGDARDGTGPMVLHYDGATWERLESGLTQGNLWWVFGFDGGPVYVGGDGGVVLRYEGEAFTQLTTPGTGTVFGLWGASPDAIWAVGGTVDKNGFAWRLNGDVFEPEPSLPADVVADAAIWKMHGRSADDAWLVGVGGVAFHWDGTVLSQVETGVGSSLFTVYTTADRVAAVGGFGTGVILEDEGMGFSTALPAAPYGLTGVVLEGDGGYAVGQYGLVLRRDAAGWHEEATNLSISEDLHGVWIDPDGGVWAAGGVILNPPVDGILLHKGDPITEKGI